MQRIARTVLILAAALPAAALLSACGKNPGVPSSAASGGFFGGGSAAGAGVEDLSSYRVAYFQATGGEGPAGSADGGSAAAVQESDESFRVVDYGPVGELPEELRRPSIYVVFSQPVVPLARLGEPVRNTEYLKIDPPLEGVYRWYGSRLLAFESDAERLPQRRYTVTVSDALRSLGGKALEGERSFSFETERLSLLSWHLGSGEGWVDNEDAAPEDARRISLLFSYPVNLEEISKWVEVRINGVSVPADFSRPSEWKNRREALEQAAVLTLRSAPPANSPGELVVREGARSESAYLGTREEARYAFHTLKPFVLNRMDTRSWSVPRSGEDSNPIYLEFSHPVDGSGLERQVSVEGLPVTAENVAAYGSTVVLSGLPVRYETSYRVSVSPELKDAWGRPLGRAASGTVEIGAANSYAYVPNRGSRMLEAAFPPKVAWELQNPLGIRRALRSAEGPYERLPKSALEPMDLSSLPKNVKRITADDLVPYLGPGGKGSAALRWEFKTRSPWEKDKVSTEDAWLTVQVTDIGLTVRYAYNRMLVWATRLSTGEAVREAQVELMEGRTTVLSGRTDAAGMAVFDFPAGFFRSRFTAPNAYAGGDGPFGKGLRVRVSTGGGAAAGGDQAEFIPNESHNLWRFDVQATANPHTAENKRAAVFLFTDRGLYRPGETVSFRGVDRNLAVGVHEAYRGPFTITVSSGAYRAPPIATLSGSTTATGGSHGSFALPADLAPGTYYIQYQRQGANRREPFTVANFERLRFEADLAFPEGRYFRGERIAAAFSASYLAGGALSGAPYSYTWMRESAVFNPGGSWASWRFGPEAADGRFYLDEGEGSLGPDGRAELGLKTATDGVEGAPYRYRLEAAARDAARQEVARRAAVLVHPASFYIAARLDSSRKAVPAAPADAESGGAAPPSARFLPAGTEATLSWALVGTDGRLLGRDSARPKTLTAEFVRSEWVTSRQAGVGGRVNLMWERVETVEETRTITLQSSSPSAGTLPFTPKQSGQWELRLRGSDDQGRVAATRLGLYASGSGWVRWGSDDVDAIAMTADKAVYLPGDTARILVRSPLPKGTYLLTVEREGILSQKLVELDGSALTVDVPVEDRHTPVVYVALSSYTVRSGPPTHSYFEPDLDKPKGVFGVVPLFVDPSRRRLDVAIEPLRGVYGPGEQAELRLRATSNGKPAAGVELSFMAVDRGVVDLIDYRVPDPLAFFYDPSLFPLGVRGADSRSLLIDPVTYALADLQGGDAEEDPKMKERKDFRPTAVFEPYLVTGADGTVTVRFSLPDSLTTYRCTAVAVDTERFGIAERDLRVSAPLTATAALPRKLRWRDTAQASLILTNLETAEAEATVSLEVRDAPGSVFTVLAVDGESERKVRIGAGRTVEVPFRLAALGTGVSELIFTLRSPSVNERIVKTLTVDRPNLTETVAAVGTLGADRSFMEEAVMLPASIPEGTGTLTLSLASSRLALLKEAVGYLLDYPYGCLEQRTARLLPLIAFGEHLEAFGLESPVSDPAAAVEKELALIAKSRLADGSYPYWPGGRYGSYYVSLRIAHILALAEKKGYALSAALDKRALLSFLSTSREARDSGVRDPFLRGYALWVRAMHGERVGTEVARFIQEGDGTGVAGWAFAGLAALELGMVDQARAARERIKRFMRPGTRTVDLGDSRQGRGDFWGSHTERYALALMLFHALDPGDDMTGRLAAALIEKQRRGTWSDTGSSYWAVLAFGRIADAEAARGADFTAAATLGGAPLLEGDFRSYGGTPLAVTFGFADAPLAGLGRDVLLPLRVERRGPGLLYYTAALRYGIPAELAGPRDEGLGVYAETRDSDGKLVGDGMLMAGKTYTRRVVVSSSKDRSYVALRAPVPSGAEILDAAFTTTAQGRPPRTEDDTAEYDEWGYDAAEPVRFIMDDEVRCHWDRFPAGRRELVFRFRAVMPGVYPTPPSTAECMYEGEVFGRSAGSLIRILKDGR